jgi:DNA-directed RNA polymerase subunit M/transcription elongation factor TFIIS
MPKRKTGGRNGHTKRNFNCKKCGYKAGGPTKLSAHYKSHPSHNPKSGRTPRRSVEPLPTVSAKPKSRRMNYCTGCGAERGRKWNFCGHCGTALTA